MVNSFCHRDYQAPESNKIAVYKDRVEIWNPGSFPEEYKPEDFIKKDLPSILRNPLIANCLYLSADIEKWGSGLKRIYNECKEAGIKVKLNVMQYGFSVVFYRKVEKKVGGLVDGLVGGLVDSQKEMLELITKNPFISKKSMAEKIGISTTAVDKNINSLKKKNLIKRVGPAKGGHWKALKT